MKESGAHTEHKTFVLCEMCPLEEVIGVYTVQRSSADSCTGFVKQDHIAEGSST